MGVNYTNFLPIKSQVDVIYDIEEHDYSTGIFEFMLSGSVGSAKSIVLTDRIVDHCKRFAGANFGIGRLSLPALKGTLCQKLREHLQGTGFDYKYDETKGSFKFCNGSKITPFSWADKRYEKFRSYELSGMAFEELSENHGGHRQAYYEAIARVGRLTQIPQSWVGCATNPDSPAHWAHDYFIMNQSDRRKVYYSKTSDNPYLPASYVDRLLEIYDEKMARRLIGGEWIEIARDTVYYEYDRDRNFRPRKYTVDETHPVYMFFDFNIADGKPLSMGMHQFINNDYNVFAEVVVDGQRTRDCLEEAWQRGLLSHNTMYIVHGDKSKRSTLTEGTDYSIIENFLKEKRVRYQISIQRQNPEIRVRHNVVNGQIKNAKGASHLFVYEDAPTVDEGLRLTSLLKGSKYLEDDSLRSQHITTGLGYSICMIETTRRYQDSRSGMISTRSGRRL